QLRADVARHSVPVSGAEVPITFSVGLAVFPQDGESPADLLACADQRLYAAKRAGRNRVQGP
ncbi:MAG TPA: diguanylate cyclase, partial [Thermoanaerobaculia bacterium]|nr:diguanylate cyclase [Thermoanaerobaculia bacterium]